MVAYGFTATASCGIEQNLYVEPDGAAYPCYACHGEDWRLGFINAETGLEGVVHSSAFLDLATHTVNSNRACRACSLRYLCGGACRAWNRRPAQQQLDLDAAPLDCASMQARARCLFTGALDHLGITAEKWLAAGLPLPPAATEGKPHSSSHAQCACYSGSTNSAGLILTMALAFPSLSDL